MTHEANGSTHTMDPALEAAINAGTVELEGNGICAMAWEH